MRCRAVTRRLVAYQDRELSPGEHTRVEEHLATCARCRDLEARLAAATPVPALHPGAADLAAYHAQLDAAIEAEWANPQRPAAPPPLVDWQDHLPTRRTVAWAAAMLLTLTWGLSNWWTARELRAELAERATTPAPWTETIPADQYRPASWSPDRDGR